MLYCTRAHSIFLQCNIDPLSVVSYLSVSNPDSANTKDFRKLLSIDSDKGKTLTKADKVSILLEVRSQVWVLRHMENFSDALLNFAKQWSVLSPKDRMKSRGVLSFDHSRKSRKVTSVSAKGANFHIEYHNTLSAWLFPKTKQLAIFRGQNLLRRPWHLMCQGTGFQ